MNSLNVLHLNTWGGIGGAFIAANRLHTALLRQGARSILAYGRSFNNSDAAIRHDERYEFLGQAGNRSEQLLSRIGQKVGLNDCGKVSSFSLLQQERFATVDVLNFHNLHSEYFSYLALPKLTAAKPAVWTLHDMWAFTGHCAYSYNCDRWKTGCGRCPYPDVEPAIAKDATALEWKLKNWIYHRSDLSIVAPSRWLAEQAKQSLLSRFPIHHIPNGIDLVDYQPLDTDLCRSKLGLPADRRVLLFAAQVLKDSRKGGDLLLKALQSLPATLKAETVLLTFGDGGDTIAQTVGIETLNLGYVSDDQFKSIIYSAADLFIFPTRADNLPLVLQESLACGTPIVSFEVGGVPDLVRPGITGYLAQPEDADDLKTGIVQLLEDTELRDRMRQNCRAIAKAEYDLQQQAERYLYLYQQLLNQ